MTKVEREEHKAWLASLKPGDEAAVVATDGIGTRIMTVKGVSRDRIIMNNGRCGMGFRLDNGRVVERNFHGPHMLVPVTEETRKADAARKARDRLWGFRELQGISDAKALRIVAILDEPEATT